MINYFVIINLIDLKRYSRDQGGRIVWRSRRRPSRTLPRSGPWPTTGPCLGLRASPTPSFSRSRDRSIRPCPKGSVTWLDEYLLKENGQIFTLNSSLDQAEDLWVEQQAQLPLYITSCQHSSNSSMSKVRSKELIARVYWIASLLTRTVKQISKIDWSLAGLKET